MVDHTEEMNEAVDDINDPKKRKQTVTNDEIISNSILFMLAGTDTTANALGFVSYNLAMHQEVQDKLIVEIDSVLEKYVI